MKKEMNVQITNGGMVLRTHDKKDPNNTYILNDLVDDKRLSFDALGLIAVVLSMPTDWIPTFENILKTSKVDTEEITRTSLSILENNGYCKPMKGDETIEAYYFSEIPNSEWIKSK